MYVLCLTRSTRICYTNKVTIATVNTFRPRQDGRHFCRWYFQRHCPWWKCKISPNFVPQVPIDKKSKLDQMMDWPLAGSKPSSEQMMTFPLTRICVTRPQWVISHLLKQYCLNVWYIQNREHVGVIQSCFIMFVTQPRLIAYNDTGIINSTTRGLFHFTSIYQLNNHHGYVDISEILDVMRSL